jgi:glycosyltransferase involved in cell wall biosynthesis
MLGLRLTRSRYGLAEDDILFVQAGKMDRHKRIVDSLLAFSAIQSRSIRFIVAGHLHNQIEAQAQELIRRDPRIEFVGWQSSDELRALLCAADVYVQPRSQSVTMQMSLCCRCAVIIEDVPSHRPFVNGNGWLISDSLSLEQAFQSAARSHSSLRQMSMQSSEIANRYLDYKVLSARLYA